MAKQGFVVLGIPVTVDPFFIIGIVFLAAASGSGSRAIATGVAIAGFTLVHELGHALTARRFGATSSITLSFLMGWASYSGPVRLSRTRRVVISLAGPLTQLTVAVVVLVAIRAWGEAGTISLETTDTLWNAVMWAGVLLAFLNLLPLWPLDGGHILEGAMHPLLGQAATRAVQRFTLGVCAAAVVLLVVDGGDGLGWLDRSELEHVRGTNFVLTSDVLEAIWRTVLGMPWVLVNSWFILLFCGFASWRSLRPATVRSAWGTIDLGTPTDRGRRSGPPKVLEAERNGWYSSARSFPAGWGPSPWLQAQDALAAGSVAEAQRLLATVNQEGRWVAPPPDEPALAALVGLLPPLVPGASRPTLWTLEILANHGDAHRLAHDGLAAYDRLGTPDALYLVAAGLARLGMADEAMAWLRRASVERPDAQRLATGPEFRPLHGRTDFQQLLAEVRSPRPR